MDHTLVIVNPKAGSYEASRATIEALGRQPGWSIESATDVGAAQRLAGTARARGFRDVIVAGGDGTIADVVSAVAAAHARPRLGVLPLGTGNDLARALGMPLEVEEAARHLVVGVERAISCDLIEIDADGRRQLAINAINGGVATSVTAALAPERKQRWGPLAYAITAIETAPELTPWEVIVRVDDGAPIPLPNTFSVVVANGQTVGGGVNVAPSARLSSGAMELVVVRGEGITDLLAVAVRAQITDPRTSDLVHHCRCRRVELEVPEDFGFSIDGEIHHARRLRAEVLAGALTVLAGPDYQDADDDPARGDAPGPTEAGGRGTALQR